VTRELDRGRGRDLPAPQAATHDRIVGTYDLPVRREPHVGLDSGRALLERDAKCRNRVLGLDKPRATVGEGDDGHDHSSCHGVVHPAQVWPGPSSTNLKRPRSPAEGCVAAADADVRDSGGDQGWGKR